MPLPKSPAVRFLLSFVAGFGALGLALAVYALAFDDGDGSPASTMAEATATTPPQASSPPTRPAGAGITTMPAGLDFNNVPNSTISRFEVRWEPAGVVDWSTLREASDPFAAAWQTSTTPGRAGDFRLYIGSVNDPLRHVYTTRRVLDDVSWDESGLSIGFKTQRQLTTSLQPDPLLLEWRGRSTINPAGRATDSFNLDPEYAQGNIQVAGLNGALMITTQRPDPASQIPFADVYIVDRMGEGKRLVTPLKLGGLGTGPMWFPNGKAITSIGNVFERANGRLPDQLFIPTTDGDGVRVVNPVWSTTESGGLGNEGRAAFLALGAKLPNGNRATTLHIYDSDTGTLYAAGPGPEDPALPPGRVYNQYQMGWGAGGGEIVINGWMYNVQTAAARPGAFPPFAPPVNASPSGRYVVESKGTDFSSLPNPCYESRTPAGMTVTDTQTGAVRTLFDCSGGIASWGTWLTETRLLVTAAGKVDVFGYGTKSVFFVDVLTGAVTPLPDATSAVLTGSTGAISASPDGRYILLEAFDDASRLYLLDGAGNILRSDPIPQGYDRGGIAWSPDGLSYALLLRPAGSYFLP